MSIWTHVNGLIEVGSFRTTDEGIYAVNTVMRNMPPVATGSEGDCNYYVFPSKDHNRSSSSDEYNRNSNRMDYRYDCHHGLLDSSPILVAINGDLRDRDMAQTNREIVKFLFRFSKHLYVYKCTISITGDSLHYRLFGDEEIILSGRKLIDALDDNFVTDKRSIYSGAIERWGIYEPLTPWQDIKDDSEDE